MVESVDVVVGRKGLWEEGEFVVIYIENRERVRRRGGKRERRRRERLGNNLMDVEK